MTLKHNKADDEEPRNAAELLSNMTGEPEDQFTPENIEIPDFEEQEILTKEEWEE